MNPVIVIIGDSDHRAFSTNSKEDARKKFVDIVKHYEYESDPPEQNILDKLDRQGFWYSFDYGCSISLIEPVHCESSEQIIEMIAL